MKIVILGDLHIPERAGKLPDKFEELLKNNEFDVILCTGDLTNPKVYDNISLYGKILCVKGNMDYENTFRDEEIYDTGDFKIGLVHGRGIHPRGDLDQLDAIAERLGVQVLVSGHTHECSVKEHNGKLFLNPGSATGVFGGSGENIGPTIMILEYHGNLLEIKKCSIQNSELVEEVKEIFI